MVLYQFAMSRIHTAVLTVITNRFSHVLDGVRVVILGIGVFPQDRESEVFVDILLIFEERRHISERAYLQLRFEMRLNIIRRQLHRLDMDSGRCGDLSGRNENVIIVTNYQ